MLRQLQAATLVSPIQLRLKPLIMPLNTRGTGTPQKYQTKVSSHKTFCKNRYHVPLCFSWKAIMRVPHTRDGMDSKVVSAIHTTSSVSVCCPHRNRICWTFFLSASALHRKPKFYPQQQLLFAPPHLKHCAPHNIFLWV